MKCPECHSETIADDLVTIEIEGGDHIVHVSCYEKLERELVERLDLL